ncbi:MAG: peptidoglycan DD-metalloendopeptidase family protein [Cyanobacteria bacterium P01_D01_bin.156]
MKQENSQEPKSEISHSCFSDVMAVSEQASSGQNGRSKSVAMLGLALSFGASGVVFTDSEATAAVGSSVILNPAASSDTPQVPSVLGSQLTQPSASQGLTVYHTVEQGDSLWQIAQDHRVEVQDIKLANRISPDTPLQVGQVIKVPGEQVERPTVVSLLPGAQNRSDVPGKAPSLERLLATLPDSDSNNVLSVSEAVESSDLADGPVVVATEELTGDVSLRSAGLVSQSDGLQADLQQLTSQSQLPSEEVEVSSLTSEVLATSSVSLDGNGLPLADASENSFEGYEVRPGDTVEDIALTLGTTPEEIAEANELEDPDFIVAGDTLAVPVETAADFDSGADLAAVSGVGGFDGTRLARLQSTAARRIDASSTLQRLKDEQGINSLDQIAETEIVGDEHSVSRTPAVEDPYTADLLADVVSAQESSPSVSENAVALRSVVSVPEPTVVNPQFPGIDSDAVGAEEREGLLAAAPLDPSVYVSSPAPAPGQVVSPEMPILPSADEYLPEAPDYFNGYIWPTRGTLTSGYGWRWGRMHRGIDVAGPVGTPIVSAAAGVVERAGWNSGGYGNLVEVRHADGSMTRYAHNSRIVVRPGQRVSQGQHIADMGSTGYSTGPHLHFEVHIPNQGTINPMAMLPGR